MAGPIDFGLADPLAFYKGAAANNEMMSTYARRKAGELLNKGDNAGAQAELNSQGLINEGGQLQVRLDEKNERLLKMSKERRAQGNQMVIDISESLDQVRREHGDGGARIAFQQMIPLLRARGISDEELKPFMDGINGPNPGQFLNAIHAIATAHAKEYNLPEGTQHMQGGDVVADNPSAPKVSVVPPGGALIQQPSNASSFQVGKIYKDRNGNRRRYQDNGGWEEVDEEPVAPTPEIDDGF